MSIIDISGLATEKTDAERDYDRMQAQINLLFKRMLNDLRLIARILWGSKDTAGILTLYGTNAATLFMMANDMLTLLNKYAPTGIDSLVPAEYVGRYEFHEDGSVTLKPEESSAVNPEEP